VSRGVLHNKGDGVCLDDRRLEVMKLCKASFNVAGNFKSLPSCLSRLEVLNCVFILYVSHAMIDEGFFLLLLFRVDG